MGRTGKYLCLIGIGGSLYYVFEQLFRGFSHWSMFLLGGICFLFIYLQGSKIGWDEPLWKQILRCDIFVVSMEFMTGIVVNCMWHMNVWDYFCRTLCGWNFSFQLPCLLPVRRRKTCFSCSEMRNSIFSHRKNNVIIKCKLRIDTKENRCG